MIVSIRCQSLEHEKSSDEDEDWPNVQNWAVPNNGTTEGAIQDDNSNNAEENQDQRVIIELFEFLHGKRHNSRVKRAPVHTDVLNACENKEKHKCRRNRRNCQVSEIYNTSTVTHGNQNKP